ncbi:hypothetical protein TIFTF001_043901, partial [Ficus carica]
SIKSSKDFGTILAKEAGCRGATKEEEKSLCGRIFEQVGNWNLGQGKLKILGSNYQRGPVVEGGKRGRKAKPNS